MCLYVYKILTSYRYTVRTETPRREWFDKSSHGLPRDPYPGLFMAIIPSSSFLSVEALVNSETNKALMNV